MSKNKAVAEITMTYQEQALVLSNQYGLGQTEISIKPIGSGHINTTLLLSSPNKHLVVQKLNTQVFPDSDALVSNARKIEKHLTKKAAKNAYDLDVIKHVATQDDSHLIRLNGETWRALEFIGGSYSEDVVKSTEKAKIAAGAFGQFAKALNDFEADSLKTVIPDFHNLSMRINALDKAVAADKVARVALCEDDIAFCQQQRHLLNEIDAIVPDLPIRACHNDTKINNMLFCKKSDQAKAVIDLDTCMPGYWMFDFGDMVRTFCSPEAEDSTDLDKVKVRENIFASIVEGYVEPLKKVLSDKEKQSFWLGAKVMTFMIGVRFLTDYLDGDNYFTIHRENHNLDRARNQFALYQDLLKKEQTLKAILFK
jgi:Ser/Thr protein kinase RdoA (MazF antagonist)